MFLTFMPRRHFRDPVLLTFEPSSMLAVKTLQLIFGHLCLKNSCVRLHLSSPSLSFEILLVLRIVNML